MAHCKRVSVQRFMLAIAAAWFLTVADRGALAAEELESTPAVGDQAPDFKLSTVDGESVELATLTKSGAVVVVVLRGYPGYQCPVCNAQVGQFVAGAKKLKAAKANVVLVYPGEADGLKEHASEFIRGKTLPGNVFLALDPDFEFTQAYHLRWDAKNETTYPSTFVVNSDGKIAFAKISKTHGDRATLDDVLKALRQ